MRPGPETTAHKGGCMRRPQGGHVPASFHWLPTLARVAAARAFGPRLKVMARMKVAVPPGPPAPNVASTLFPLPSQ